MPLIECPDCKKEVSDSAKSCPSCGYNIKSYLRNIALTKTKDSLREKIIHFFLKYPSSFFFWVISAILVFTSIILGTSLLGHLFLSILFVKFIDPIIIIPAIISALIIKKKRRNGMAYSACFFTVLGIGFLAAIISECLLLAIQHLRSGFSPLGIIASIIDSAIIALLVIPIYIDPNQSALPTPPPLDNPNSSEDLHS